MAEDQGVNGDIWNEEACKLFQILGWEKIGDSNIDVKGDDSKMYGIDTFLRYPSPHLSHPQSLILEAKRYATNNFHDSTLKKWIEILDKKIIKLRNSQELFEQFPILEESSTLNTAIIVVWFHDWNENHRFHKEYLSILSGIKISSHPKSTGIKKIVVLHNDIILKLCSLYDSMQRYKTESGHEVLFFYPSSLINNKPVVRQNSISIEYIYSKIILAESKNINGVECKIVFYFGMLSLAAFKSLKAAIMPYSYIDKDRPLIIYIYTDDIDFRKIRPDVENLFEGINLTIKFMDHHASLPPYLKE